MDVTLSPFGLTFSNACLEKEYVLYSAKNDHHRQERIFVYLEVMLLFGFLNSDRVPFSWSFFGGCMMLLALHFITLKRMKLTVWVKYRFWIHFLLRVIRSWILKNLFCSWRIRPNEHFLKAFATQAGLLAIPWYGLGMKTIIRHFVWLQGFSTIAHILTTSRTVCTEVLNHPDALETIKSAWTFLSRTVLQNKEDFECLHGNTCEFSDLQMCSSLFVLAHVHISFGLPVLLNWLLEIRSRHKYVEEHNRQGRTPVIRLISYWRPDIIFFAGNSFLQNMF